MHRVSCSNSHHDVPDLINHRMDILRMEYTFLKNEKIINLCLKQHILRSCRFVAEVTFKPRFYR